MGLSPCLCSIPCLAAWKTCWAGLFCKRRFKQRTAGRLLLSVANALDAGAEVVILAINGFLSDHYGIGFAWVSLAAVGLLIFLLAIFGMQSKKLEVEGI